MIWLIIMLCSLFIVLYCERKHGTGKKLQDYSQYEIVSSPNWAKTGVLYQVFPRVFTKEGNFRALKAKLSYIKDLGIDVIWLMPVFPIGRLGRKGTVGSPYAVKDFRVLNPDYGSEKDFQELVDEVHRLGMKVIIGFVPNHGSNDNILLEEYPDWFMRDKKGSFLREVKDWSDVIDFNFENPDLRQYMIETLAYWIEKYDIDGYRCDVAGMVPYDFWKEANAKLREVKKDIFLLAEWEDPEILLTGFNSDYGWTEYHLLKDIRHGKRRSAEIVTLIEQKDRHYPENALAMRFLENHDEQRSVKVFGVQAIDAYATLLFTLPGIPLIYAGQELGEIQKPSLFEKSVLDWKNVDSSLIEMYQTLIRLRKQYDCFTVGKFTKLGVAGMSGSVGVFLRESDKSLALVVCNLRNNPAKYLVISLPEKKYSRLKHMQLHNYNNAENVISLNEIYVAEVPAFTTLVFVGKK